jgi:ribonuclease HI
MVMPVNATGIASSQGAWLIHCDGSAFPNPGNMGLGATMAAPDGTLHKLSALAPGKGCNNEAEARAMMAALRMARLLGATCVRVHSDSRVVVDQLTGNGGQPIARLDTLFTELRGLLATFEKASVKWIPQHRNHEADTLARTAAGLPPRPVARPAKSKAAKR